MEKNLRYYIQCDRCNRLVELKSQYMTFCPACKGKLGNSFTVWKERNPDGTYREYLEQTCVNEAALEGTRQQRRVGRSIRRSRNLRRAAGALAVALLLAVLGGALYWWLGRGDRGGSIRSLLKQSWKIAYYEDLGVTVKFPYTLEQIAAFTADSLQVQTPEEADSLHPQIILGAVSRRWADPGVVQVTASRIDYEPDFGVDRDLATGQILLTMLEENNLRGFEFFRNDYSVPNLDARSMSGSYLLGAEAFEFRALMVQQRHTVWYFMVSYPRSMPEGLLVAERFFKGILIDRR